jgi:hypothetical protein
MRLLALQMLLLIKRGVNSGSTRIFSAGLRALLVRNA